MADDKKMKGMISGFEEDYAHHEEADAIVLYNSVKEYFESFPPGMRFKPSDEELIVDYLINKINGRGLPINRIRDVKLYDYPTPEDLIENYELVRETEWYFFTPRYKRYPNGNRPDLRTPGGYWKPTGGDIFIRNNGQIVGVKRSMTFFQGETMVGKKTDWLMQEYRVYNEPNRCSSSGDTMKLNDWILCKIYQSERSKKRKDRPTEICDEKSDKKMKTNEGDHPVDKTISNNTTTSQVTESPDDHSHQFLENGNSVDDQNDMQLGGVEMVEPPHHNFHLYLENFFSDDNEVRVLDEFSGLNYEDFNFDLDIDFDFDLPKDDDSGGVI